MAALTEDDVYRASSQYRLWSFTPETLASLRATTNALAADAVRKAIRTLHNNRAAVRAEDEASDEGETGNNGSIPEVDCLTVEEEQKLVGFYCVRAMQVADFCDYPTNVKATAAQFLRRFYLSNSPMTYHPKELVYSAVFLATKTENHYTSLKSFVSKLQKTTAEDVIAPEFLVTQGLRFTFDVRHPQRGLEGGFMELMAMAKGDYPPSQASGTSSKSLQAGIQDVPAAKEGSHRARSVAEVVHRIQVAYNKAKETLKTAALLTDVYFLYTPSQIWLAALLLADRPLTQFFLDVKLPVTSAIKPKVMGALHNCGEMLRASPSAKPEKGEVAELKQIDKKLYKCRNPEKIDLVSINRAHKRDSEGKGENGLDEKVVKKRKMERERSEKESADVFGPTIPIKNGK